MANDRKKIAFFIIVALVSAQTTISDRYEKWEKPRIA